MSHYSSSRRIGSQGLPVYYRSTHLIKHCWNCNGEIVAKKYSAKTTAKICSDCGNTLTQEQIKALYSNHYKNMREQLNAKKQVSKPCDARFIMNSPFRKATV